MMPQSIICFLWLFLLPTNEAFTQENTKSDVTVIQNATIHTMAGEVIQNGSIIIRGEKIESVGLSLSIPQGATVINASGQFVFPTMIGMNVPLGLKEIDAVKQTHDMIEKGENNADIKTEIGLFADSELIPVARANGIGYNLSSLSSGLVSGHSTLIRLNGWTSQEMIFKSDAAMVVNWPRMTVINAWWMQQSETDQKKQIKENIDKLDTWFTDARTYLELREKFPDTYRYDSKWDGFSKIVSKSEPVIFVANTVEQIRAAVEFGVKHQLWFIIHGGREAYLALDLLKSHNVPVILGAVNNVPDQRDLDYDLPYRLPAMLHEAGILFAISNEQSDTKGMESNLRNLPYEAAQAAAFGLDPSVAYQAISLNPAKMLQVDDKLGTIEPGKLASLIITDGHPLDIRSQVKTMFLEGKQVTLESRHTRLKDRYEGRYQELEKE